MNEHGAPKVYHVHHYIHFDSAAITGRFDAIDSQLAALLSQGNKIMASIDDVIAKVAAEATDIESMKVFIAGLKQQIQDALSGVTLPPAVQAKVDAVFASVSSNDQAILDAITTPAP